MDIDMVHLNAYLQGDKRWDLNQGPSARKLCMLPVDELGNGSALTTGCCRGGLQ